MKHAAGQQPGDRPAMAWPRSLGGGADPQSRRRQGTCSYAAYAREEQRRAYCVVVGGWSFALMAVLVFAALIARGL